MIVDALSKNCLASLLCAPLLLSCSGGGGDDEGGATPRYQAKIQRTSYGIPHITAADLGSAGFGQGYAFAEDHACMLADQVLKVRGERAMFLGAGEGDAHVRSDVGYLALGVLERAEATLAAQDEETRALIDGYAAGYNKYLADVGVGSIAGHCRGADWVRPISSQDLMAYLSSLALSASGVQLADFIAAAAPPGSAGPAWPGPPARAMAAAEASGLGSNGWALGSERSAGGGGMVVANPHFPWLGELKLWESHVTVPGALNVYGATLMGVPGVLIGFNESVGWTHTFSVSGKRFTAYTLKLVPGEPTRYYYDGEIRDMTPREYTIAVKQPDGSMGEVKRTIWSTHYGPMINVNNFGWSEDIAVTYRDGNIEKTGLVAQWHRMNRAGSLAEFKAAFTEVDGIPWVHTMAADKGGETWYIDAASTPRLSQAAIEGWQKSIADGELLPTLLYTQAGVVVLDGSTSVNEWQDAPGRSDGLVPAAEVPQLAGRRDFVMNANDSHWLANPAAPLVGYSPMHGEERAPLSLRSRNNLTMLTEVADSGASGADGRFTIEELQGAILSNRSMSGELLRAAVAQRCQGAAPVVVGGETVPLTAACQVLAGWDGRYDVSSVGATLWRELMGAFSAAQTKDAGPLFAVGFDPEDPIGTPRSLAAPGDKDLVLERLGRAVLNLQAAGIALETPLGEVQYAERAGLRVPIHGGQGADGVANMVYYSLFKTTTEAVPPRGELISEVTDLATDGYSVNYGSSYIMTLEFTPEGPKAAAIMTYGQSDDVTSPHHTDQLGLFSRREWRPILFKEEEIAADPALREYTVASAE
jgi:acyl-homoserine-lactone acylase